MLGIVLIRDIVKFSGSVLGVDLSDATIVVAVLSTELVLNEEELRVRGCICWDEERSLPVFVLLRTTVLRTGMREAKADVTCEYMLEEEDRDVAMVVIVVVL